MASHHRRTRQSNMCKRYLVGAKNGSEQISRNVSWFKKFQPPLLVPDDNMDNKSCTAESKETSEDTGPEKPLPDDDSVGNDRALSGQDSPPVIIPGRLMSPAVRVSESRYRLRNNPTPCKRL
ncbi:hypothetical protein NDU88_004870 [Pleurodeles waltl]|uniref:Uncharacterized protein n=1 Tax=Pleurodeles waltl TaxID=8319 RepID=A0AAV7VLY9_PLEWA|nr:hypothetical protein NDU88_004870 [Pleurodeles waltl]